MNVRVLGRMAGDGSDFPDPVAAPPEGLLAVGGDLSPARLVAAYLRGIYPWYDRGTPILWWSPDPRCALLPDELHVSRSLARCIRSNAFEVTFDKAFALVIRRCAATPRQGQRGTWLVPAMINAYEGLHRLGIAHSAEAWQDGRLVGGLYGVALGGVFYGESMFHLVPEASKVAFTWLATWLRQAGCTLIDCQQTTPHMVRFGARELPRPEFLARLADGVRGALRLADGSEVRCPEISDLPMRTLTPGPDAPWMAAQQSGPEARPARHWRVPAGFRPL
uniref:Leucyl/phenylalanyl-tRNA--protein transferase n=1 Tax=Nitratidesulfovibrio vulgaris (strain DSM 19637 / Miyazaki F) TaxID=883 RepID=B8DJU2_NITV9